MDAKTEKPFPHKVKLGKLSEKNRNAILNNPRIKIASCDERTNHEKLKS
jgi:hypothetical protein